MLRPATKRTTPTTISAIYLVKDEEECLPLSVATVIDFVDEVIIIDTKSTDNTLALAKAMAAMNNKVRVHSWDTDFDESYEFNLRNRARSLASSEWFLIMDADQLMSDGWRAAVGPLMRSHKTESIAVSYEHWVGSYEYIHNSFYEKQHGRNDDPDIPLFQTCLFRNTNSLIAKAAADHCPQFRPAHHSRHDESVPYENRARTADATMFHLGFAKRNSIYMGEYRVYRGDYGHDAADKDWRIAEIRQYHNGFRFVGSVHRVDYGPERAPSVMRHMFGNTYNLELDKDGFIQRRTFVSSGEVTP